MQQNASHFSTRWLHPQLFDGFNCTTYTLTNQENVSEQEKYVCITHTELIKNY